MKSKNGINKIQYNETGEKTVFEGHKIISLYDLMKEFKDTVFSEFSKDVRENKEAIQFSSGFWMRNVFLRRSSRKFAKLLLTHGEALPKMREECERYGLEASKNFIDTFIKELKESPLQVDYYQYMETLNSIIENEKKTFVFLALTSEEKNFYTEKHPFGETIENKFSSLSFDILEASKCIALERYTATVFHLMRVMEGGLNFIAIPLGIDIAKNPNWHSIIEKIEKNLNAKHGTKDNEWQRHEPEYKNILATINSVKDAWRNPTMHVENKYTPQEAKDIFNNVGAFVRNLADNPPKPE